MKALIFTLACGLLTSCVADQQELQEDGYFGDPGHTFTGDDMDNAVGGAIHQPSTPRVPGAF